MDGLKFFDEIEKGEIGLVGGKGLSLSNLNRAGFLVPPGFVVTTEGYRQALGNKVGDNLREVVLSAFDALGAERVAVRSSAIAEDSKDASWAGQFESYLNVTRENLIESVEACWQSASSEAVKDYAESKSIEKEKLAIAVVVQKMVNSEVSGVAFSVNPINKNNDEIMIEAIYGLGELLVQGMITPDNYLVDKSTLNVLKKTISHKGNMLIYQNGENVEQPVLAEKADEECLDDNSVSDLAKVVVEIEKYYGMPQDIEWALEGGNFYIVQSRPITTLT